MPVVMSRHKTRSRRSVATPPVVTINAPTGMSASPDTDNNQHDLACQPVSGATYYSYYYNTTDTFSGSIKLTTDGVTTMPAFSRTVSSGTATRFYYFSTASRVDNGVTTTSAPSSSANCAHPDQATGDDPLNIGQATFWPGYRSLSYEVATTGDRPPSGSPYDAKGFATLTPLNREGTASARYRVNGGAWRDALDPLYIWDSEYKQGIGFTNYRFFGDNLLWFNEGDAVDVEVTLAHPDGVNGVNPVIVSGTIKTSPPDLGSLTETYDHRYVDPAGSDGAAGTIGAPWATLDHALDYAAATNGHQYIHLSADYHVAESLPVIKNPGVTGTYLIAGPVCPTVWDGTSTPTTPFGATSVAANAGSRAVLYTGRVTGPAGATEVPVDMRAAWTTQDFTGPRTSDVYTVYTIDVGFYPNSMGFSDTWTGDIQALAPLEMDQYGTNKGYVAWSTGVDATTLNNRRAEFLHTNDGYRYGYWRDAATGSTRIYLRLPPTASSTNPDDLYLWMGNDAPLASSLRGTPNADGHVVRIENIEVRGYSHAIRIEQPANWHVIKGVYSINCQDGVVINGDKTTFTYAEDILIEDCYFRLIGIRAEADTVPDAGIVPWVFIKGPIEAIDGDPTVPGNVWQSRRTAENLEGSGTHGTGGAKRSTVRRCTVKGLFNGLGGSSKEFDRYAASGYEEYHNTVESVADEGYGERGKACMFYRCFENYASHTTTFAEHADGDWGPQTYVRCISWRNGTGEIATTLTTTLAGDTAGAGEIGWKCSGGNWPQNTVRIVNCAVVTDQVATKIIHKTNGGQGFTPYWWLRNNIFRCDMHVVRSGDGNGYDEDYCLMAGGEGTRVDSAERDTLASYRGQSRYPGIGTNTNVIPGTATEFDMDDVTTLDSLIENIDTGDIRLKVIYRNTGTGVVVPNLTNFHDNGDSAPDCGPMVYADPA